MSLSQLTYSTVTVSTIACIWVVPLRSEDAVEHCALPAVSRGLQDKHVLDNVEGEAVIGEGTQELSLQEGSPLFLQDSLTPFITLKKKEEEKRFSKFIRGLYVLVIIFY